MKRTRKRGTDYDGSPLTEDMCQSIRILVASRLIVFGLQLVGSSVLPEAPTDAFKGVGGEEEQNFLSKVIIFVLKGFSRWDSQRFLHIAKYGYTWESMLAFQPLYPTIVALLSKCIPYISQDASLLLAGVLISNTCFLLTGLLLHKLIIEIFNLTPFTRKAAIFLFAFNPSSIFFSSLYTESTYAFLTFSGIYALHSEVNLTKSILYSSLIFSIASLARSNGILNVGFIGYKLLALWIGKRIRIEWAIGMLILSYLVVTIPVRMYESYVYTVFCGHANNDNYFVATEERILPGDLSQLEWCVMEGTNTFPFLIVPNYYTIIQKKYWDVGMFSYWQLKKIPNFIMAAPSIYYVIMSTKSLMSKHVSTTKIHLPQRSMIPFALLSLFFCLTGLFVYNVEVVTRILFSSSPYIPISMALAFTTTLSNHQEFPFHLRWNGAGFNNIYFFVNMFYFVVGTICHSIWLPFV